MRTDIEAAKRQAAGIIDCTQEGISTAMEICAWFECYAQSLLADVREFASLVDGEAIQSDPQRQSGRPVVGGHRVTVGQLVSELTERGESLESVCEDTGWDYGQCVAALNQLAKWLFDLRINAAPGGKGGGE